MRSIAIKLNDEVAVTLAITDDWIAVHPCGKDVEVTDDLLQLIEDGEVIVSLIHPEKPVSHEWITEVSLPVVNRTVTAHPGGSGFVLGGGGSGLASLTGPPPGAVVIMDDPKRPPGFISAEQVEAFREMSAEASKQAAHSGGVSSMVRSFSELELPNRGLSSMLQPPSELRSATDHLADTARHARERQEKAWDAQRHKKRWWRKK